MSAATRHASWAVAEPGIGGTWAELAWANDLPWTVDDDLRPGLHQALHTALQVFDPTRYKDAANCAPETIDAAGTDDATVVPGLANLGTLTVVHRGLPGGAPLETTGNDGNVNTIELLAQETKKSIGDILSMDNVDEFKEYLDELQQDFAISRARLGRAEKKHLAMEFQRRKVVVEESR